MRLCPTKRELGVFLLSSCCFTLSLCAHEERKSSVRPVRGEQKVAYMRETAPSRSSKQKARPRRGREVASQSTLPVSTNSTASSERDAWSPELAREDRNCQCPVCCDDYIEYEPCYDDYYDECCDDCCEYDSCCCYYLRGLLGYGAGSTVGLCDNYGQVGLQFGTASETGHFYKAIEANGFFLEGKRWAWNVGALLRWYDVETCSYFGMNIFYDYRDGCYGNFQQVGLGFEAYLPCFTLTGNAYVPVGKKCAYGPKHVYDDYEDGYVATCRETELAMCGFNLEIGREYCINECFMLHPGIGPYYFSSCDKSSWGVRFRTRFRYTSRFGIDFQLTHDSIFNTRAQALFYISFPIGIGSEDCCCDPCDFFLEPVDRFDIIPLGKCCSWEWNW